MTVYSRLLALYNVYMQLLKLRRDVRPLLKLMSSKISKLEKELVKT